MITSGKENRSPFIRVVKRTGMSAEILEEKKRISVWIQNVVCSVLERTFTRVFFTGFFFSSIIMFF